jgi:putative ABC transport system permease protein
VALTVAAIRHWAALANSYAQFSMRTAIEAVRHNRLRASLTSLGILFGVASVIAMLAIGKGAEREILEQMVLLGSNNVMVTPLVEQSEGVASEENASEKEVKRYTPGLTYADAQAIARGIPSVVMTSAELVLNTSVTREGRRRTGKVVGVDTSYFDLTNLELGEGAHFTREQAERGLPVAIIGYGVRTRFFTTEAPIGKPIKVGDTWLTVVGVLTDRRVSSEAAAQLGVRDANMDVYVPVRTALLRFRDRARITQRDIELAARASGVPDGDEAEQESEEERAERTNRNQIDRVIIRVADAAHVSPVAEVARRMLTRRHNDVVDFEIKTIFNIVLGAIASISLIVGGIGIMNIMLASVLERIREIGVRRAVGATQREILLQFLSEAVLISVAGGVAGIIVGAAISAGIERFAGITTLVSLVSVMVAFGVSFAVGVAFGIMPAYKAARQDPVVCLRYE